MHALPTFLKHKNVRQGWGKNNLIVAEARIGKDGKLAKYMKVQEYQVHEERGRAVNHEFGHVLGLVHPGQLLPPAKRPPAESDEDYDADRNALMGRGFQMRAHYFKLWEDYMNKTEPASGPWITDGFFIP